MTNREHPVWQAAYAAKFASLFPRFAFPEQLEAWKESAEACANAAVGSLGVPELKPSARNDLDPGECGICERCTTNCPEGRLVYWLEERIWICRDCIELNIPDEHKSKLSERFKVSGHRHSDSELLDAILAAYNTRDIYPGPLADAIKRSIVERSKR